MTSKAFRIEVEPVNEFITTEGMQGKLRIMAGGVGLRLLSVCPIDEQEDHDTSMQARLINWIQDQGGNASVRDVQRAFGFRSKDHAREMMQELTRSGAGRWLSGSVEGVELIQSGPGMLSGIQAASDRAQEAQTV